jgi:succinate-acetate transporter protein
VSLVTLVDLLNVRREGLISLLERLDRGQLLMVTLCVILVIDFSHMSWVSLGVWLMYLVPLDCSFDAAMLNSRKPEKRNQTIGFYVMVHSVFVLWMSSLMKYEGYLELNWKYLMAPVAIVWLVACFFILAIQIIAAVFTAMFNDIKAFFIGPDKAASK